MILTPFAGTSGFAYAEGTGEETTTEEGETVTQDEEPEQEPEEENAEEDTEEENTSGEELTTEESVTKETEEDTSEESTENASEEASEGEEEESLEEDPGDGEAGEEGNDSGNGDPSLIITGDAVAGLDQETSENFNDTEVSTASSTATTTEETDDENGTSTPEEALAAEQEELENSSGGGSGGLPGDTTASTTNDATIENNAGVGSNSGDNSAGGDGSVIATGNAIAFANIINLANTNIFNSEGLIAFFSQVLGISSLDLRDAFDIFESTTNAVSTAQCNLSVCNDGNATLNVENTNDATIDNDVVVTANSGGNTIDGDGAIVTGDAYAAANIFNLANTNIVDSSYLLLSFNNFGDYAGDIILPHGDLLSTLFGAGGTSYANATVTNNNHATITNAVSVEADTGDNESEGGVIATGDAYANGAVSNMVNTNLFGGSDLLIVLRIHGNWNGDVIGLPDGIEWAHTENGIVLYNTGEGGTNPGASGDVSVINTNNATINNDVSVYALTGDNKVDGEGLIATGDAYAAANVTNVANTNILGQNWALLVFDIFGNWNGNLTFGQSDLWIGGKATPETTPIVPGTEVTYTFTVTNRGDSMASNVVLDQLFNQRELQFHSSIEDLTGGSPLSQASWHIGDIEAGETKRFSYTTTVADTLSYDIRPISVVASVTSDNEDANEDDNTETITIYSGEENNLGGGGNMKTFPANLEILKEASADHIEPGGSVDYTITITNHGGPLYRSLLRDILTGEDGEMMSEQYWELGTIHTDETVSVSYTTIFGDDTKPGTYVNSADIKGLHREKSWRYGDSYMSSAATHELTIGGGPQVLGASTDMCDPYLKTFLKRGVDNDPEEVSRLQEFLNEHTDANLDVNGVFDLGTELAVRAFQSSYADDVLAPWGMSSDSGYVYLTTRKKINEIYCDYGQEFPLNASQKLEIEKYRNGFYNLHNTTTSPIPLFGEAESGDDSGITLDDAAGSLDNVVLREPDVNHQTTTPSPIAVRPVYPFVAEILRALEWFRELARL